MNTKKLYAEFFGTFWLVFGGCGSAVLAAAFPEIGIGLVGVSLAFGLTVLTMAYTVGCISGGHFNPAVTIGVALAGKHPLNEVFPYIIVQCLGGIAGAGILYLIATGRANAEVAGGGFASNGYGAHSPGGYNLLSAFVTEFFATAFFLFIILGSTDKRSTKDFAPIAIGFALTLIHLITIPVTNTSVNPARSLGPAVFVGGWAIHQLWLFFIAPILGAVAGSLVYKYIFKENISTHMRTT